AIGRTNRCLHDIARLFRYARTNAIASGRAHLVVWQDADGGRFATFAGDSSSCARSWWEMIVAKDQPIDVVPLDEYETRSQGHGIEVSWRILGGLALAPAGALQATCFEPDGRRFDRFTGNGAFVPTQGAVVVEVVRMENGANAGDPLRRVMIPEFGGASVWQ
ncbi:MAG: hypothetical protein N2515_08655, partial [Deltaproteobacteria bacterium]|nr:hypothetical protein [Deltaproteobacteria bacterium]